jgi:hypothetical protein
MRKQKTITLGRETFTVKELRVRDIHALLDEKDIEQSRGRMLSLSTGLDAQKLYGMRSPDLDAVWNAVREVNTAFLQKPRVVPQGRGQSKKLTAKVLDRCICRLIERGHAQVWNYGWTFFMAALTVSEDLEKDRLRSMAIAARLGNTTQKDWKKFLSER